MKKIMLPLLFIFAIGVTTQAQSNFDKAAEFTANHICKCFNENYKDMADMLADENGEKGVKFEECLNSIDREMENKFKNLELEPGFSEEMMFQLMLEKLAAKKECEFAHLIMQMGMGTEEEEINNESDDEGEE